MDDLYEPTYEFRFFFEAGSHICLWSANADAWQCFHGPVSLRDLVLPLDLILWGEALMEHWDEAVGWYRPPVPWEAGERAEFHAEVSDFLDGLDMALGREYRIIRCGPWAKSSS
ncbi:hypothetical protein [Deinococcus sp. Marseille-Q6407]|uniref:hypothetical protein n=1 Tax=Deinococcus sp. Marseille-Q6407 TaxID=2969223 RepID=UPI0021C0E8F8|nr:hypothetical protein [Deinococcus sp. Marseille-Q6407]